MNYFPFHIGDFDRATRHLTRIERSIYLDLIFLYYDTERALVSDLPALCRKVVARTDEEKTAVTAVLDEFFIETPTGWFHERCEEVLADYRKTLSQASDAGKASAAARAARKAAALEANGSPTGVERRFIEIPTVVERRLNGRSTDVELSLNGCDTDVQREPNGTSTEGQRNVNGTATNQEPRTKNHKPRTKQTKPAPPGGDADLFPDVDPQVVVDFKALRKRKDAPVTATAMQEIVKQAGMAGLTLEGALRVCCARGWAGFKAEWVQDDRRKGNGANGSTGSTGSTKFQVAGLDHSSTKAAAEASMQKHGIVIPDGDIEF